MCSTKYPKIKRCGVIFITTYTEIPEILLVRGAVSKIWSLPKGCINPGETEEETAMRETYEETGVDVYISNSTYKIYINRNTYFVIKVDKPLISKGVIDINEVDIVKFIPITYIIKNYINVNKDIRFLFSNEKLLNRFYFLYYKLKNNKFGFFNNNNLSYSNSSSTIQQWGNCSILSFNI